MKTRKVVCAAMAFMMLGCASNRPGHDFKTVRKGDCATIDVDNQGYADITLYQYQPRQRLGYVTGLTDKTLTVCNFTTTTEVRFEVRPLAGQSYVIDQANSTRLVPGAHINVVIGERQWQSYVIGAPMTGDPTGQVSQISLWDAEQWLPWGIHIGIWADVLNCLDLDPRDALQPFDVQWWTALALVDEETGTMAYGVTTLDENEVPYSIVIQRDYWVHPTVISHEILHAVTGIMEEELLPAQCILPVPGSTLPLRYAPPELLDYK